MPGPSPAWATYAHAQETITFMTLDLFCLWYLLCIIQLVNDICDPKNQ